MKLISWNVNGVRAIFKKDFLKWMKKANPDILCLQETKAQPEQLSDEILKVKGYHAYFSRPERKGYSGVALYTKIKPKSVDFHFGNKKFNQEGRVVKADYGKFILFNIYFPNGGASDERLKYKLHFYDYFLRCIHRMKNKKIIICGDYNTAHHEIDLARPGPNETNSGFIPIERRRLDKLAQIGYLDTFRLFNKKGENYTWWDMKTRARERNVGWRIDYFWVSKNLKNKIKSASIAPQVMGSDHCPVSINLL